MEKMNMRSRAITEENIKVLLELFPQIGKEIVNGYDANGKPLKSIGIDFDALRQELEANLISDKEERYQFTWPEKKKAALIANEPITATLRPCREESVDFDNTNNLYIEGDNLDVLKLLQETYLGRVKMIYIDPPYNTVASLSA